MMSQLPHFRCLCLSCQQQKDSKNGAAVTSLRSFLFGDNFKKLNHSNFKCFLPVCPTCQCWSEQAYIENVTIVSASDTDLSHTKICIKYRKHGHYFFSSTIDFVHILSTSVKIGTKLEPYNCADDQINQMLSNCIKVSVCSELFF